MLVKAIALLAIAATAVILGFAAGIAVIAIANSVLPPFREDVDDDTIREFVPVALAYLAWVATSAVVILVGWRRLTRKQ